MCGILGVLNKEAGSLPARPLFEQACGTMAHRGPDDQGVYEDPLVLLGHRRLSIIDLSTGQQPIHNEDKTVWTVFNGEIYNYVELKQELEQLGHRFYTHSDGEVIVHGYEQWGAECFARFRGMFAIALWDRRHEVLLLARDPLGKKPLYYSEQHDLLVFASELKAIQALPGLTFSLDESACRDYLLMGYVPTPKAIFREARKLRPGHYLYVKGNVVRETSYWSLNFEPKHPGTEAELVEQLDALLNESVCLRLRSDVPFGVFLSGGLDSSVVAILMAKHLDQPVKTFSVGFEDTAFNELSDARLIARHIQSDHHEFIVKADAVSLLDKLVWHFDEPFADNSAIPTYLVAKMASNHVKMVLSGDGGDEAFGGYERYLKYQVVEQLHGWTGKGGGKVLSLAGSLIHNGFGRRLSWLGERVAMDFPASYLSSVALSTPTFADGALTLACTESGYGLVEQSFQHGYCSNLDAMIHGDIRTYLLDDILVKMDRMTMANSLEARSPLLDQELIQWAARLPNAYKMRNGKGKYLLRRIAKPMLPPQSLTKNKQGFAIPLGQWFRTDLRDMVWDLIRSQTFKERGVFNPEVVAHCLREHETAVNDHSEHLWQCVVFELWAQQCMDRTSKCIAGLSVDLKRIH
jgi:asparagine synthase (glutamine-hydrolysing)